MQPLSLHCYTGQEQQLTHRRSLPDHMLYNINTTESVTQERGNQTATPHRKSHWCGLIIKAVHLPHELLNELL